MPGAFDSSPSNPRESELRSRLAADSLPRWAKSRRRAVSREMAGWENQPCRHQSDAA